MKIILIVIVLIFIVPFVGGVIMASIKGNKKRRRAYAIVLLASLPEELIIKMKNIWLAYQDKNVLEANRITASIDPELLEDLLDSLTSENRPFHLSSGKQGDSTFLIALTLELDKMGYSTKARKVISGIIIHKLNEVLLINKKLTR